MSREAFIHDALFGMPGVPSEPGWGIVCDEGGPNEAFQHPHTEATYQVWLRGYKSKALAVRDQLKLEGGNMTVNELGREWQESGFIPKRPGDL